jgi:hypothetical protein
MDKETEAKITVLEERLGFIKISLSNAAKKLNKGDIVQASILEDLNKSKKAIQEQIEALKAAEATPNTSPPAQGEEKDSIGIPERLRIPRSYTMSPEAIDQRKKAAKSPAKSEAMKGNRNGWKTGKYAQGFVQKFVRPCLSTCPHYPCSLVNDGDTEPGGVCLDKAQIIDTFSAIMKSLSEKNNPERHKDLQEIMALKVGSAMQIADLLMESILRDGPIVKSEVWDKDGNVMGFKIVSHPSLFMLPKMLADLNLSLGDLNVTPRAQAKTDDDEKTNKTLATILGGVASKLQDNGGKT